MPYRPKTPCAFPGCPGVRDNGERYCAKHVHLTPARKDERLPSHARGYGYEWRKIRAEVLTTHGIPKDQWHLYDVDHNPPYDPKVEPNHRAYTLIPKLHGDHSRKTCRHDGGFGNNRRPA